MGMHILNASLLTTYQDRAVAHVTDVPGLREWARSAGRVLPRPPRRR
jgi:hypothetical protein